MCQLQFSAKFLMESNSKAGELAGFATSSWEEWPTGQPISSAVGKLFRNGENPPT
jgi:hypothetical protein